MKLLHTKKIAGSLLILVLLGASCQTATRSQSPKATPDPIALTVVVPDGDKGNYLNLTDKNAHLDVIIENVSTTPQTIWAEWCSWGYYNLSLEVTALNGKPLPKPISLTKGGRAWSANFPDPLTLQPGEKIVRELYFRDIFPNGPRVYDMIEKDGKEVLVPSSSANFPATDAKASRETATIKAVFQIDKKEATAALPLTPNVKVWTGKIESQPQDYTVVLTR